MKQKYTNDQIQGKPNNFGVKFGNQENITKKPNRKATGRKKDGKGNYTWIYWEWH